MGCPFHSADEESTAETTDGESPADDPVERRGIDRREFVRSALAIGGVGALVQLDDVAGMLPNTSDEKRRSISAGERLNRQHAWDAFEDRAASLHTKPPHYSLFLFLNYRREGEPTPGHRKQVERALSEIEEQFEWHSKGVMFTMAYSADYFDRFDGDLPEGARPWDQETVVEHAEQVTTDEPGSFEPEDDEALLLLTSDNVANLLAVEEALWGNDDDLDVAFDHTFEGVFDRPREFPSRRVGFLGPELPKDRYDEELGIDVPDKAPLSMGFIAGFDASQPHERAVTLKAGQQFPNATAHPSDVPTERDYVGEVGERDPGIFAQGTLKHVSHVTLDLEDWYDESHKRRREDMYSPFHTAEDVGEVGENLTEFRDREPGAEEDRDGDVVPDLPARDRDREDYATLAPETATEGTDLTDGEGALGHSQKAARARYDIEDEEELVPPVIRRDWDGITASTDIESSYQFNIPTRFNEGAMSLFEANYKLNFKSLDGQIDHSDIDEDERPERNGIAPYMQATRRGHFLVPPISLRALPHPQPETVDIDIEEGEEDAYVVAVDANPGEIDDGTVQFGRISDVNRAQGAKPVEKRKRAGKLTYVFEEPAVDDRILGEGTGKFFAKRKSDRKPVVGTGSV